MSSPDPRDEGLPRCENHPTREGVLAVDLPSLGIRRYLCTECNEALRAKLSGSSFKGKREAWDHAAYDYQRFGHDLYTRTSAGWRCENPSLNERRWK